MESLDTSRSFRCFVAFQHLPPDCGPALSVHHAGEEVVPTAALGKREVAAEPRCLQGTSLLGPSKATEVARSRQDHPQSHLGTLTFLTPTFQVTGNKRTQDI